MEKSKLVISLFAHVLICVLLITVIYREIRMHFAISEFRKSATQPAKETTNENQAV